MTSAYLIDNPPRRSQYRKPRRSTPSGTIVIHTAENLTDITGPDTGAESVARFIQGRSTPGSYHLLGDRDSIIQLVPFEFEAFHDGTGSNPWSIGISAAMRAEDWRRLSRTNRSAYLATMVTMARRAADWLHTTHGIDVPAHRVDRSTARSPGFCSHAERETWFGTPGRRSDPGFDADDWAEFLDLYAGQTPTTTDTTEDDVMFVELIRMAYRRARGKDYDASVGDPNGWSGWMLRLAFADSPDARRAVVKLCNDAIDREIAARK